MMSLIRHLDIKVGDKSYICPSGHDLCSMSATSNY